MKKSIALIGAFFMGAFAFAQVSKTDTINKTAGRKVLSNDMQNVSTDTESEAQSKDIKGSVTQKGTSKVMVTKNESVDWESENKNGELKGSVTQKGRENLKLTTDSQSKPAYKMTSQSARAESDGVIQKGRENRGAVKAVIKKDDSTNETTKASDPYIKISSARKE